MGQPGQLWPPSSSWREPVTNQRSKSLVRDFCARVGLSIDENSIRRVNSGMKRDALCILYADRKFNKPKLTGSGRVLDREMRSTLNQLSGPKVAVASSLIQKMLLNNPGDLAWAEERVGARLLGNLCMVDGEIGSEADLFKPTQAAVSQLALWAQRPVPNPVSPEAIAALVAAWRSRLIQEPKAGRSRV